VGAGHATTRGHGIVGQWPRVELRLVGEFQLLIDGVNTPVAHGVQRLLGYLGVAAGPMARSRVAGELWPEVPEWRALGNLRSSLWRLGRMPRPIVDVLDTRLALRPDVAVDLAELNTYTDELLRTPKEASLARVPALASAAEILPGWEDEWLVVERERFRELRLHALELACAALLEKQDFSRAVQAALAATNAEPYRESAQRLLIKIHMGEGNAAAALRAYHRYRDLIAADMGIEPSESMEQLVAALPRRRAAVSR
jgi:DNA-binding SARP family transcriptional activator